jgi:hypothetical protein
MYTSNQFEISQFEEKKETKEDEINVIALKQKTMKEIHQMEKEEANTGVFHPEDDDTDSGCSIEEKENISK